MTDDKGDKGELPGNHGQFGESNATEDYKPLQDHPASTPPTVENARQAEAGQGS